jgi:predicted RNase H-like HicB family nuclease
MTFSRLKCRNCPVAWLGDTQEGTLRHVKQAIKLWIDTSREFGDPIPEPRGERLMLA